MKDYQTILDDLQAVGNKRKLTNARYDGNRITVDGRTMLNLSSNDYLGLTARKELRTQFLEKLSENDWPFSSTSSRLLTGNHPIYSELESLLATRYGKEAALVFNSGYHTNLGILPAIADRQTLIVADKLVHASIIDGIRLSQAAFTRFRHNDYDHLEELLCKSATAYQQIIIVVESIYSMDGDTADLQRLAKIKHTYPNTLLYVDEAHAVGVCGATGLGLAEETGTVDAIDLLVGTFGKALASMGAFVACSRTMREYLINTMRPLIFSTALPPVQVAWTHFLFSQVETFAPEREKLARMSAQLRRQLAEEGGSISRSHIIPLMAGENEAAIEKAEQLQRQGFYCLPIRPPTVPRGTARIRLSLTAGFPEEAIDRLVSICKSKTVQ